MENEVTLVGKITDVEFNGTNTRVNIDVGEEIDICTYLIEDDISDCVKAGDEISICGWIHPQKGSVMNYVYFKTWYKVIRVYFVYKVDKNEYTPIKKFNDKDEAIKFFNEYVKGQNSKLELIESVDNGFSIDEFTIAHFPKSRLELDEEKIKELKEKKEELLNEIQSIELDIGNIEADIAEAKYLNRGEY